MLRYAQSHRQSRYLRENSELADFLENANFINLAALLPIAIERLRGMDRNAGVTADLPPENPPPIQCEYVVIGERESKVVLATDEADAMVKSGMPKDQIRSAMKRVPLDTEGLCRRQKEFNESNAVGVGARLNRSKS